jgi:hypothetical protein
VERLVGVINKVVESEDTDSAFFKQHVEASIIAGSLDAEKKWAKQYLKKITSLKQVSTTPEEQRRHYDNVVELVGHYTRQNNRVPLDVIFKRIEMMNNFIFEEG